MAEEKTLFDEAPVAAAPQEDDGSLAFLKIKRKETNKQFNCEKVSQQKLVNTQFWIVDFVGHVKTPWGEDQYIVKIKNNPDDPDSEARKFFTGSQEIKDVLEAIKEMDKFPRRVTLRAYGNRYFLE